MPATTPQQILTSIQNTSIVLPPLPSLLSSFPLEVNPALPRLRQEVDIWISKSVTSARKIKTLKAADFGYFGATWWPRATYERLRILTFLAVWVFTWDDELDEVDGELWDNELAADVYREDTVWYIRACLGLQDERDVEPTSKIIRNFEMIGKEVRKVYYHDQCERLAQHIEEYIQGCKEEELYRQASIAPTVEEYWAYRLKSSAVCVTLAMQEYAFSNMRLSSTTMSCPGMHELWTRANIIISTVNDLLSLKKEIKGGNVASMVPLLFAESRDAQRAVDMTADFITENVEAFEDAANLLLSNAQTLTAEEAKDVEDFILGCRFYTSGNLSWSLSTKRYRILREDLDNGVEITL